jgi:hypothetical protein
LGALERTQERLAKLEREHAVAREFFYTDE